ncbi:MAG: class I SAM-dependent methyltransferase [Planctomycetota bacterium]
MRGTIEDWQRVTADTALLERAAEAEAGGVGAVAKLRKTYDETAVALALELVKARGKAAAKFGQRAKSMVADVPGIEQASGHTVAAYKAERFRAALGEGVTVADLCCGIGGDTAALCDAGLDVLAVDHDPVRAWMAGHNSGGRAETACMDVADWPTPEHKAGTHAIHLDPARRDEAAGRRLWKLDNLRPPPEVITRLIERAGEQGAAVKLGPGVDLDAIEDRWPDAGVEFIAEGNRLVQAVLWTGKLRRAERSATLITRTTNKDAWRPSPAPSPFQGEGWGGGRQSDPEHQYTQAAAPDPPPNPLPPSREGEPKQAPQSTGIRVDQETHTLDGTPGDAPLGAIARYLYAVHPAVERAGLIHLLAHQHDAPLIHRKLGLLSRDTPTDSPWLTGFELLAELPWRPKKVKRWLTDHDGGIIEVKTRGKAVDPDAVSQQLRGKGGTPYTVFVLRFDVRVVALVCRRV